MAFAVCPGFDNGLNTRPIRKGYGVDGEMLAKHTRLLVEMADVGLLAMSVAFKGDTEH